MTREGGRGWSRRRKILTIAAAGVVAVVVAIVLVWMLVWRGDAPPPPSVLERSESLTATTQVPVPDPLADDQVASVPPPAPAEPSAPPPDPLPAAPAPPPEPEPPVPPPREPEPAASAEPATAAEPADPTAANLDGVWSVNTTLGSFEDYTSSWAGYRVGEELSGIGTTDAVGRTQAVSGSLEIAGTTVTAAEVEVDLTTVVSDRPQRDGLVRRSLDTEQFPFARFELVEPVTFESLPAAGESVTATVVGAFEIHGASRPVELSLEATWIEGVVIVGGTFEIRFEDYGIVPPRAPVVLSVEDVGTIELLLNFTR
ncbi:MAG: YceI family protein [Acidimicrobiia bacterium]|nr:YceI family protein [Acidimicrobiia bacterium]